MHGLMMDQPLLISMIMKYAEQAFPESEVVSVTHDHPEHRYTYHDAFCRARKLANALDRLGMRQGDRVATLAWNDFRHFELYYGVSCSGAVLHTINPRLFTDQLAYIINHAEDRWVFTDPLFIPLLEGLQVALPGVEGFVILTDQAHMPDTSLKNAISYEALISDESDEYEWPMLDEQTASSLCYTSGTTGHPKGVLYSHRSTVIHAMTAVMPSVVGLSDRDVVMPVVPMFHVNAWGLPYTAPLAGARLVLPGPKMGDGASLHQLISQEQVSLVLGVPTVWLALLNFLKESSKALDSLQRVIVGGAACPQSIMDKLREYGVDTHHAWGMTEMSPIGTLNNLKASLSEIAQETKDALRLSQGRAIFGVDMKIVNDTGERLPHDGVAVGDLYVRGPSVCSAYYQRETEVSSTHDKEGWFATGDVAAIDGEGYLHITDRSKDVIKSGGEWISSIELENLAMSHPAVAEAAVIAVPHEKWNERPLLIVVKQSEEALDKASLLAWYEGKVAQWWIPDEVIFVEELPHTATGKVKKLALREQFVSNR